MKRRYLVLIVVGIVLPVLGLIGLYLIENRRGAQAWEILTRDLAARGESLDITTLVPPPIPDGENLALAPLLTRLPTAKLPSLAGSPKTVDDLPAGRYRERPPAGRDIWTISRPLPLAKWQQFYAKSKENLHPAQPGTPAADVLIALGEFAPTLDEIVRETETRPRSRLPVDWKHQPGTAIWIPQGQVYSRLTDTLRLRASAELADGQPDKAWRDTAAAWRLAAAPGREPLLNSFLTGYGCGWIAMQPVWEGLAARRWNAAELTRLQAILRQENYLANCVQAARGDRALLCATFDLMRISSANGQGFLSGGSGKPTSPLEDFLTEAFPVMPSGWVAQNKAVIARLYQNYIDAVDLPMRRVSLNRMAAADAEIAALRDRPWLVYTLVARFGWTWSPLVVQRAARLQTARDQAVVACALELYYLDRQTYPETLDTLVPVCLDRVPNDVIDGAPMRYRRTEDGRYLLYGIGWNGRDDGGTVAWQNGTSASYPAHPNDKEGDWVWQYTPMDPPAGMW